MNDPNNLVRMAQVRGQFKANFKPDFLAGFKVQEQFHAATKQGGAAFGSQMLATQLAAIVVTIRGLFDETEANAMIDYVRTLSNAVYNEGRKEVDKADMAKHLKQ